MADTPTADSLQIEIVASSDDAIRKINRLAKALEKLKAATTGFGDVAKEISDIGAVSGAAAESTGQRNTRARKEALNRATSSIKSRTITSDLFPGTKEISLAIDSAIKKYDKFVGILEQTRGAITRPAAEEYLREIRVEQDGLNKILEQVNSGIGQTPKNITTLQYAAQDLKGIEDTLNEIWSNPAPENINWDSVLRQSEEATKAIENDFASAWENIKEKFSGTILGNLLEGSNSIEDAVGKLAGLDDKVTILKIRLDGLKEKLSEAFEKGNISQVAQYTDQIRKLREEIKNLENPTEKAEKATGKFQKLLRSIKHIAVYRMIRDALTAITDGIKEGIDNLYQYSAIMNTDFAPAMDRLATSSLYLKNSLGAMAAPIIQVVTPAIEFLTDKLVDVFNLFNQLAAKLSGASTYTKAVKYWTEYAESTDKAAKSVKNFMLGIDELNVINDQRSGFGSLTEEDYEKMFIKDVPIEKSTFSLLSEVLDIVTNIGGAFAAWKIGSTLVTSLLGAKTELTNIQKIVSGLALITIGVKLTFGAGEKIGLGEAEFTDYLGGLTGILSSTIGGALIGSAIPGIGTITGGLAGLTISIAFGIAGVISGQAEVYESSEFHQQMESIREKATETIEFNKQIKINIETRYQKMDEIEAEYESMLKILDDMFALNDKPIKTAEEIEMLKSYVDVVNSWNLEGVTVQWNDLTKSIEADRDAITAVIEELKRHAMVTAAQEMMVEAYQDLYAEQRRAAVEIENYNTANEELNRLREEQNALTEKYSFLSRQAGESDTAYANRMRGAASAATAYQSEMAALNREISDATSARDIAKEAIIDTANTMRDVESQINNFSSIISGSANTTTNSFSEIGISANELYEIVGEKDWPGLGKSVPTGLERGIRDNIPKVTSAMDSMGASMVKSTKSAHEEILSSARRTVEEYRSTMRGLDTQITIDVDTKQKSTGKTASPNVRRYASGGFPEMGQMFIARERGPELVGNIGQKTAVVNNEQIISGISQGVENANEEQNALLREQNELLRALLQKDTSVVIGNKAIKRAYDTATRQSGASIMAGGVVG